jgi:hypothetical protein
MAEESLSKNNINKSNTMKKAIYILSAAIIVLSSTLAFTIKTQDLSTSEEKHAAAASKNEGFALQDQDQWK